VYEKWARGTCVLTVGNEIDGQLKHFLVYIQQAPVGEKIAEGKKKPVSGVQCEERRGFEGNAAADSSIWVGISGRWTLTATIFPDAFKVALCT
jgi:hypothetical protein